MKYSVQLAHTALSLYGPSYRDEKLRGIEEVKENYVRDSVIARDRCSRVKLILEFDELKSKKVDKEEPFPFMKLPRGKGNHS